MEMRGAPTLSVDGGPVVDGQMRDGDGAGQSFEGHHGGSWVSAARSPNRTESAFYDSGR
ncbi:hypothetical protein GCM10010328_65300 [Streptomyces rubiginosohelvolus]|uniref:Uncharacterized protein n=1 Tax=Streptomyces rubiginosohelvolus TaxID=67362 RepID=A0ABQ3CGV7_9ACTN|nr:hypothetical protein GCM10010328_65300 [Streptomyces pluricolorescens]